MSFLLLIDTSGIQNYIFQSNEMKIIAKASLDIEKLSATFSDLARLEAVEVIMAAGGNASFCSDNEESLKRLCRSVSRFLLGHYPGLEVVAVIHPYEKGQLSQEYRLAGALLEQKKLIQERSVPFSFPGLKPGKDELLSPIHPFEDTDYIYPNQTDDQMIMKVGDEKSDLMAVVTMDGLRMGGKFFDWLSHAEDESYEDEFFIEEFNAWSTYLKKRWESAWNEAVKDVIALFPANNPEMPHPAKEERLLKLNWVMDNSDHASRPYLPVRKIFQGGDDLTFICDAHISISFVRNLIHYLEDEDVNTEGIPERFRKIAVSAGIVMLDSHFPFIRAVNIAGDVRNVAKKAAVKVNPDNPPSRFEWWVNRSGALRRDHDVSFTSAIRPCAPLAWDRFEQGSLLGAWNTLKNSRNKLKGLGEAAQNGSEAVKEFLALRGVPSADDPNAVIRTLEFLPEGQKETGFDGSRTALVDIAELYDLHFFLPRRATKEAAV